MEPGAPQGGRPSSSDVPESPFTAGRDFRSDLPLPRDPGFATPRYEDGRYEPPSWTTETAGRPLVAAARATSSARRIPGSQDRHADATGPLVEPAWWSRRDQRAPGFPPVRTAQPRGAAGARRMDVGPRRQRPGRPRHPSAPLPPDARAASGTGCSRAPAVDDAATVAQPLLPGGPRPTGEPDAPDTGERTTAPRPTPSTLATGRTTPARSTSSGTTSRTTRPDAAGAGPAARPPRPRVADAPTQPTTWTAPRPTTRTRTTPRPTTSTPDDLEHDVLGPRRPGARRALRRGHPRQALRPPHGRPRRRRRPVAILISLLVLAALVAGIVVGGQKLLGAASTRPRGLRRPGHRHVGVRVQRRRHAQRHRADARRRRRHRLRPARSSRPPRPTRPPTGIQPGVYAMRKEMSGQAALDLLLDPAARLLSRVTLPEGLTVQQTLERLAEETGTPDGGAPGRGRRPGRAGPARLRGRPARGLPLPGHLRLRARRRPGGHAAARWSPAPCRCSTSCRSRSSSGSTVVTKASLVQAEAGSVEDMGKVARVLDNRLADGHAAAAGHHGELRQRQGRHHHDGRRPGQPLAVQHLRAPAACRRGRSATRARTRLARCWRRPPGDRLFFVVVDPDTGETRFAATAEEHGAERAAVPALAAGEPGG